MPGKSSRSVKVSSVPRERVLAGLAEWAASARAADATLRRIGVFGSYARGDQTPASDVDVLVVVASSTRRPWERPLELPPPPGPVGAEIFVYTEDEIAELESLGSAWLREVLRDICWIEGSGAAAGSATSSNPGSR